MADWVAQWPARQTTPQPTYRSYNGHDYSWALAGVVAVVIAILVGFGTEAR